jgi:hypothetical protein
MVRKRGFHGLKKLVGSIDDDLSILPPTNPLPLIESPTVLEQAQPLQSFATRTALCYTSHLLPAEMDRQSTYPSLSR